MDTFCSLEDVIRVSVSPPSYGSIDGITRKDAASKYKTHKSFLFKFMIEKIE